MEILHMKNMKNSKCGIKGGIEGVRVKNELEDLTKGDERIKKKVKVHYIYTHTYMCMTNFSQLKVNYLRLIVFTENQ